MEGKREREKMKKRENWRGGERKRESEKERMKGEMSRNEQNILKSKKC